ncbi:MAG: YqhA family protein, partial [Candidatus Nitrotoga sp.]
MLNVIEKWFEATLWNGRFVVVVAVVASMAAAIAIFYMATIDVVYLVSHMLHYADFALTDEARKLLHDQTISHVVEV